MKNHFLISLLFVAMNITAMAQFTSVQIKVDGLTCSACSYATQKSILELSFVDSINLDLNTNIAIVKLKPSQKVDIGKVAQKVYDAGFSVGSLYATYNFNSYAVADNTCFTYEGDMYHFVSTKAQTLNGPSTMQFIGKKFMNMAERKKWKGVKIENTCKNGEKISGKVYTVTIQ
jgi:copper chaperone CopZ